MAGQISGGTRRPVRARCRARDDSSQMLVNRSRKPWLPWRGRHGVHDSAQGPHTGRIHEEREFRGHPVIWGTDSSLVEVVGDIRCVMAFTCTVAELTARIRDRLKARREQGEGDS